MQRIHLPPPPKRRWPPFRKQHLAQIATYLPVCCTLLVWEIFRVGNNAQCLESFNDYIRRQKAQTQKSALKYHSVCMSLQNKAKVGLFA